MCWQAQMWSKYNAAYGFERMKIENAAPRQLEAPWLTVRTPIQVRSAHNSSSHMHRAKWGDDSCVAVKSKWCTAYIMCAQWFNMMKEGFFFVSLKHWTLRHLVLFVSQWNNTDTKMQTQALTPIQTTYISNQMNA